MISPLRKPLPEKMLVAYTSNHCHNLEDMAKVTQAVIDGVNVLIWVFIAFEPVGNDLNRSCSHKCDNTKASDSSSNKYHRIRINSNLNVENYKLYREKLRNMGYADVLHLVAFGGWNGPHLPSGYSSTELYDAFQQFNTFTQSSPKRVYRDVDSGTEIEDTLFDGIDWDLEGHDNAKSLTNEFTKECLDQMGEFSAMAKKDGYIISMAPPESYLDITSSKFSRFVNLTYPEPWHQDFEYHGWNVYAYVLAKWNPAIDFIFLQFYESYSHAAYQISQLGQIPSDFLVEYISNLVRKGEGLFVNFEDDLSTQMENQFVHLPLRKLVFGFANGWALNNDLGEKTIFFHTKDIQQAYQVMLKQNRVPRGFGFWVIEEEGNHGVHYAEDLKSILESTGNGKISDIK